MGGRGMLSADRAGWARDGSITMGRLWVILIGAAMACAAAVSGGCTETRAIIDVDNLTGQPVRVEMLTVDKHGTHHLHPVR